MRVAYADPPYPGQARRHYKSSEVNHRLLIAYLETFDAWALSTSSTALQGVLSQCPLDVRIGAWVKPFAVFKPGVNPGYCWEPVIWKSPRPRSRQQPTVRDWVSTNVTLHKGLSGAKPDPFSYWLFELLNIQPEDELEDVFPGTRAVSKAFAMWQCRIA